jgi:hypothetical protein
METIAQFMEIIIKGLDISKLLRLEQIHAVIIIYVSLDSNYMEKDMEVNGLNFIDIYYFYKFSLNY